MMHFFSYILICQCLTYDNITIWLNFLLFKHIRWEKKNKLRWIYYLFNWHPFYKQTYFLWRNNYEFMMMDLLLKKKYILRIRHILHYLLLRWILWMKIMFKVNYLYFNLILLLFSLVYFVMYSYSMPIYQ